jgi:Lar family restriction alleviation protein
MKLKPCPFCGGTRIKTRRLSQMLARPAAELDFYKHCENCNACGPLGVRPTSAGALWNDRIDDPDLSEMPDIATPLRSPISARSSPYGTTNKF